MGLIICALSGDSGLLYDFVRSILSAQSLCGIDVTGPHVTCDTHVGLFAWLLAWLLVHILACPSTPANNSPGYCTDVCCDQTTEETCNNPPLCALIVDGGCPCPEGQEKCEVDLATKYTGNCVDVCCDRKTEETCYTSGCQPSQFCAKIIDGGCPCLENQVRRGQGKIL